MIFQLSLNSPPGEFFCKSRVDARVFADTISGMNKEGFSLADHHVHAQDIEFHNEISANNFGIEVGDHLYPDVDIQRYVDHARNSNLNTMWMIYEDIEKFQTTKEVIEANSPECTVKGFFFVRNPANIDCKVIDQLYRRGLIQGIKIHPVIDNFPLLPKYVDKVMRVAMKYDIPVIFHSDDRPKSRHLTSPANQLEMASAYPEVRLVIGHGGAYAHPRLTGENNTAAKAYWKQAKELVLSALELTLNHNNVYYESSIVTNKTKADLIVEFVKTNPEVTPRIILGSDFPIIGARLDSQLKALVKAGLDVNETEKIATNRL